MRYARTLRAALGLTLALIAGGCGGLVHEPRVTLENVSLGGIGLRGGTLLVSVQVDNPNSFALNANQLTYQLSLSDPTSSGDTTWVDFANGTYDQPFSVPAHDSARVQIPVEFSYTGVGAASSSILNRGTVSYRATGTVDVRTPIGTRTVPFRKRGTFTLMGAR